MVSKISDFLYKLKEDIYALEPEAGLFIGKPDQGQISNYYLGEPITDDEVAAIQIAAEKIEIDILNTRYARPLPFAILRSSLHHASCSVQKNGPNEFILLVASADTQPDVVHKLPLGGVDAKLIVRYGDFAGPLSRVVKALTEVRSPGPVCVSLCHGSDLGEKICRQRAPERDDR